MLKPTYSTFKDLLGRIVEDIQILSGDDVGPSNSSWQDVAGTLATNMEVYAKLLHQARSGSASPTNELSFLMFPSLAKLMENREVEE